MPQPQKKKMTLTVEIPKVNISSRLVSKKRFRFDTKTVMEKKALLRQIMGLEQELKLTNARVQLQDAILEEYKITMKRQSDQITSLDRRLGEQQNVLSSQESRIKTLVKNSIHEKLKSASLKNNVKDLLKMIGKETTIQDATTQTEEAQDYFKPAKRLFEEPLEFWDSSTEDFEEDYKLVI